MMSFIAQAGAVPLGYVSEMIDSEVQCLECNCGERMCSAATEGRHWQYIRNISGGVVPQLPDLVLSNTPPPSPLRRAFSCPFFPTCSGKDEEDVLQEELPMTEAQSSSVHGQPPCLRGTTTKRNSPCHNLSDVERETPCHPFQQRISSSSNHRNQSCPNCHVQRPQCHIPLPQLLWEVPVRNRLQHSLRRNSSPQESLRAYNLRSAGRDLRKIADRFQLEHGKVTRKSKQEMILSVAFPEAFTRCLTASVLCLIWWRLFNKFR